MKELRFPLSWSTRIYYGLVAIVGTMAYTLSFIMATKDLGMSGVFKAISIAASSAWVCLGWLFAFLSLRKKSVDLLFRFADICLSVMKTGNYILFAGIALNAFCLSTGKDAMEFRALQLFIVAVADVAMAWQFTIRSGWARLKPRNAFLTWVLLQNGVFAAVLYINLH